MKRILQALDTASTQPVEGANSMSKFLRIVKEAELNHQVQETEQVPAMPDVAGIKPGQSKDLGDGAKVTVNSDGTVSYQGGWGTYVYNAQGQHVKTQSPSFAGYNQETDPTGNVTQQNYTAGPMAVQQGPQGTQASYQLGDQNLTTPISEGANPHRVSLPVQMAMNHYQAPKAQPVQQSASLLRKYFAEAEEEVTQVEADRKERLRMYSQKIAERVLVKESIKLDEKSTSEKQARFMAAAAHNKEFANRVGIKQGVAKEFNKADAGTKQLSQAMKKKKSVEEGLSDLFTSKPKVNWNVRAKELFAKGFSEEQVRAQLLKEGCPARQVDVYVQAGQLEEAPIDMTGDPNDPTVYGHAKANPMSLKGRIQQARNQLKELANMAESDDLVVWQKICQLSKGGMFMGLEQNIEQVRHGIEQLAAKRKQGGVASRGIDKNIGEVYDGEPDEYHVLRHQTKDDIEKEITPKAWTRIKEFDGYQAAKKAYDEMKSKHPNEKFTVTTHSKQRREEQRKQWGLGETGVVDAVTNKLVSAGASARKAVDTAINSIPRPFDEKEVANDLQKQKRQS